MADMESLAEQRSLSCTDFDGAYLQGLGEGWGALW